MSTSYDFDSPTKTSVILDKPSDWDEWLFLIKEKAVTNDVWQYSNPTLREEPTLPSKPTRPVPSDVKAGVTTIQDLTPDDRQTLQYLRDDYKSEEKEYLLLSKGIKEINNLVCTTISRTNLTFILQNCDTPYQKLKALQRRLAPTDRARELELVQQYNDLKKTPRAQGVDKWLQRWEKIYADALRLDLPDVQRDRPLYDFLQAVKGLDSSFSSANLTHIMGGKEVPTLFDLIEQFRNTMRINNASDKNTYSHSAFPTFQGTSDSTSASTTTASSTPYKPICICGEKHFYRQCYYLIESIRPKQWSPNSKTQRKIQEKLANDQELAERVERARTFAKDVRKPSNTSVKNSTVGAFTASYNVSTDYKLQNSWILDSGSDVHVCNELVTGFTPTRAATDQDKLYTGKTVYDIEKFGSIDICVRTPQGMQKMTLLDTAYVPGFLTNLVSLSRLVKKGVHWNTEKAHLHKDGKTLCYIRPFDGHWILNDEDPVQPNSNASFPVRSAQPRTNRSLPATNWHQILGHASQEAIQHLPSATNGAEISDMSTADVSTNIPICEVCRLAKAKQVISRRTDHEEPTQGPFNRVSYDLIPMTEAYNRDKWISHFRCYQTGMNHIYTHPKKSDANDVVQEYCQMIDNRYNATIRFFRSDGERTLGTRFDQLIQSRGMVSERTAPDTPAQNGHSERSGGVIISTARSMRIHARLPENLWPEIVKTAGYLLNRTPTKALNWKTPFELAIGIKPSLSHLHIYGCKAYTLSHGIPRIHKLQPRAFIGYLVGYDSTNIYRIWLPTQDKVIRTRDVTFNETTFYDPADIDITKLLRERAPEIVETLQGLELPVGNIDAEVVEDSDEDIGDTIVVRVPTPAPSASTKLSESLNTLATQAQQPTPETTPETTPEPSPPLSTGSSTAPRALEISATLADSNVLPEGSQRLRRKRAYAAALFSTGSSLNGYHSAFSTAVSQSKSVQQIHRDSLPPPPKTWKQMLKHLHAPEFKQAAQQEYDTLVKRSTFLPTLKDQAHGKILPLLWVFTYKFDSDGYLLKHKARICVRGDLQFTEQETYAATLACRTFRALMAITAVFDLEIVQLDAINAFLNSKLNEQIYVEYPEGFGVQNHILLLLRALYGLKQSPLLWYQDLTATLEQLGLRQVPGVNCLLTNDWLVVFFYVDDIILLYHKSNSARFNTLLSSLKQRYEMRTLNDASWFLGIRILRDRDIRTIWLCQDSYIDKLATKFNLATYGTKLPYTPMDTNELLPNKGQATPQEIYAYQQRIGSINFAAVTTRPDIAKACSKLSEFLQNPSSLHLSATNRVLGYLLRTKFLALEYSQSSQARTFLCASDAAFADNSQDRRSSDGYVFTLYGGPIDWKASKQKTVTTSSTEAELLALSNATKEVIWWNRLFKSIQFNTQEDLSILSDNQQTIRLLTKDAVKLTTKLKHVDIHQHWLRQEVQQGNIRLQWVSTNNMLADGMTKPLTRQRFEAFLKQLNLQDIQDKLN